MQGPFRIAVPGSQNAPAATTLAILVEGNDTPCPPTYKRGLFCEGFSAARTRTSCLNALDNSQEAQKRDLKDTRVHRKCKS
jgi:hypothetical protein